MTASTPLTPQSDSLVIIPTYNEKENVAAIIDAVAALPRRFDILIIDDNSLDYLHLISWVTAMCTRWRYRKMADHNPSFWCGNPLLRIIYGLFQLLGVVFVIGFALYLTFAEHWWYILVYLGGVIIAKLLAFILQIPIALIFSKQIQEHMYGGLIYKRLIGTVLIILGLILLLATL